MVETKSENFTPGGNPSRTVDPPSAEDGFMVYGGSQTLQSVRGETATAQHQQTASPQTSSTRHTFFQSVRDNAASLQTLSNKGGSTDKTEPKNKRDITFKKLEKDVNYLVEFIVGKKNLHKQLTEGIYSLKNSFDNFAAWDKVHVPDKSSKVETVE